MTVRPRREETPTDLRPSRPLVSAEDVRQELERLFGGLAEEELVVTVHGAEEDDVGAVASYRELLVSLEQTGAGERMGASFVRAPSEASVTRALAALSGTAAQRELLDGVLTVFGRRFIDPLGNMLDATPEGLLRMRLARIRSGILEDVEGLGLTRETRELLGRDLEGLLSDEYLEMLADHEEQVQRPKVEKLARDVLHLLGETFRAALAEWPEYARSLAASAASSWDAEVELRDIPGLVRGHVVPGIEEFFWTRTGPRLRERLESPFASHGDLTAAPAPVDREDYRDVAKLGWDIIARRS
jgi:hypothetical protein